ncbi:zinc finger CCCH domain-containing protein 3 [Aedes aegypti]|uniref:Zinc finger CCCH domain-containing protein 3 n=1 Tax=Aedes aegypti TaxID=7159 RepID=A0A1S4F3K8_AEDAE|nr:zinc finger CCCH domain-containing protein 3 [Aedes aegypti]
MDVKESRSKIFINPEFKKAHINRNFLTKNLPQAPTGTKPALVATVPSIHFNPAFLERLSLQRQQQHESVTALTAPLSQSNPIIKNTKRKLVRASSAAPATITSPRVAPLVPPLVKLGRNKLVRSVPTSVVPHVPSHPAKSVGVRIVEKRFKLVNESKPLYKLDRRPAGSLRLALKPKSSIRRFSLVRSNSISPQKVVITDRRLLKLCRNRPPLKTVGGTTSRNVSFSSQNKKMVMININGVLYRSSSNKLQVSTARTPVPNISPFKTPTGSAISRQRFLSIRGTRFMLDQSGTKLRKIPSAEFDQPHAKLRRIDIGGLTYMQKTDDTFVRTETHRTRSYLSSTKQKSIQMLTSNMRKCNVPCPIYRRLGKCTAFARGKCPKLHDKNQIMICSKFLKGECSNSDCLLSHNVSLEKMPVCHFFLEGRCTKNDCPYLHKKVSERERICEDFLKGYCPLADKCIKRHEFICPEMVRLGACDRTNCPYPHSRRNDKKKQHASSGKKQPPVKAVPVQKEVHPAGPISSQRYYISSTADKEIDNEAQLSEVQEAQLKSMLSKVEKMKQGHLGSNDSVKSDAVVNKNDEEIEICGSDGHESEDEHSEPPIRRRAKLGPLPSFIPI